MKQTLPPCLRPLLVLLLSLVAWVLPASAQSDLSSDEISEAILLEGSVPVQWENDPDIPWVISESGKELRTPESDSNEKITTTIKMSYSTEYPVELSLEGITNYNSRSYDMIYVDLDGENLGSMYGASGTKFNKRLMPAGNHTLEFRYEFYAYYREHRPYAAIRNVKLSEYRPLEEQCMAEDSMPLTFENDPDYPWMTMDGYIMSKTQDRSSSISTISTTINVEEWSCLSFECINSKYDSKYYNQLRIYIDNKFLWKYLASDWYKCFILIPPGNHKLEIMEKHEGSVYSNDFSYYSMIRNVRLHQDWTECTVITLGTFGNKLLQALEGKNLQDAVMIKVNGTLNDSDWSLMKQLTNLAAIDLSDLNAKEIPGGAFEESMLQRVILPSSLESLGTDAFYKSSPLRSVVFPDNLQTIGGYAFGSCSLLDNVDIPASVTTIQNGAFNACCLENYTIPENINLEIIGNYAFAGCDFKEFIMPNTVNQLGKGVFRNCSNLENVQLSNLITTIPASTFYRCDNLIDFEVSDGITEIGDEAFAGYYDEYWSGGYKYITDDCNSIKHITIPSSVKIIGDKAFYHSLLETIEFKDIENSVLSSIGNQAFYESNIEALELPNSVRNLGSEVVRKCPNLNSFSLNSWCSIEKDMFLESTSFSRLVLPKACPPNVTIGGKIPLSQIELIVPDFALESYKTDPYWYQFTNCHASEEISLYPEWYIDSKLLLYPSHEMRGEPKVTQATGSVLTIEPETVQPFGEYVYNNKEGAPGVFLNSSDQVSAKSLMTYLYHDTSGWQFFTPAADVRVGDMSCNSTDAWVVYGYDGARRAAENSASGNWKRLGEDDVMLRGHGYIIRANQTTWVKMPVAEEKIPQFFSCEEFPLELQQYPCDTEANAHWNFMGNPYPTYFDIYYMDMQSPITVWTGSTYKAYSLNDGDKGNDTFVLRPMQPFFVQTNADSPEASMPLVGRQSTTAINRDRAPKRAPQPSTDVRHFFNLALTADGDSICADETRVVLNEAAAAGYEIRNDASKFMSMDEGVAQMWTLLDDGTPMAINERPYADGQAQLGLYLPAQGMYTIGATRTDARVWLYDALTGAEHDLTVADYWFESSPGTTTDRFSLRFSPFVLTGVDETLAAVTVKGLDGAVEVTAPEGDAISVYNADGRLLASATATGSALAIDAAPGVCLVKVAGRTYKTAVH